MGTEMSKSSLVFREGHCGGGKCSGLSISQSTWDGVEEVEGETFEGLREQSVL